MQPEDLIHSTVKVIGIIVKQKFGFITVAQEHRTGGLSMQSCALPTKYQHFLSIHAHNPDTNSD